MVPWTVSHRSAAPAPCQGGGRSSPGRLPVDEVCRRSPPLHAAAIVIGRAVPQGYAAPTTAPVLDHTLEPK